MKMLNLKQLEERYEGKTNNGQSVTGHLSWGGKSFYEINSDEPLNLNRDYSGFILNEQGQVQLFSDNCIPVRIYYTDNSYLISTKDKTDYYLDSTEYECTWGKTLDHYYPHPFYETDKFPEKKIKAFEIIRMMPFCEVGQEIALVKKKTTYSSDTMMKRGIQNMEYYAIDIIFRHPMGQEKHRGMFTVEDCLEYPEFFRPIY